MVQLVPGEPGGTGPTEDRHAPTALARVLTPDGRGVGLGFLVAEGLLVTCAHVVAAAHSGPGGRLRLAFPHAPGSPQVDGEVLHASADLDVAVVGLAGQPAGTRPVTLGAAAGCRGHPVRSFGFPAQAPPDGHYGFGTAGNVLPGSTGGRRLLQLTDANDLTTGFSGAPVLDELTGLVVGMVTAIAGPDPHQRGQGIAYATPTEVLREIRPDLVARDVCPYRGLEPFTEAHTAWFHGRDVAVERVLTALAGGRPAVLLLGPSGSGKTSLVRAGVLPALAAGALPGSDNWRSLTVRPGTDLAAELERAGLTGARAEGLPAAVAGHLAAAADATRLLLVVDQFEEILVAADDEDTRRAQQNALGELTSALGAHPALTVLLVMRDDFYPRLAALAPELLEAVSAGVVNVPATLSATELRDIVVRPAEAVGAGLEGGLADRIVADVLAAAPGPGRRAPVTMLPLLELTLEQLWARRDDGRLTHDGYQRIGEVTGSLAGWCDAAVAELPAAHRAIAERILTALVRPADEAHRIPAVRQQVPLETLRDLASDAQTPGHDVDAVLETLTRARIVTTRRVRPAGGAATDQGQPVAELVHDALIRDWGTLSGWVEQDRRFLDWLHRVDGRRARWSTSGGNGDLLGGSDLAEGVDWARQRRLPREVATYLAASRHHREAAARRERRRWLLAVAALVVIAVLTTSTTIFARGQQRAADRAARIATVEALLSQAELAQEATPREALMLGIAADRLGHSGKTTANLLGTLALPYLATLDGDLTSIRTLDFRPDGRLIAVLHGEGTVLWDLANLTRPVERSRLEVGGNGSAFSPDGRFLVVGGHNLNDQFVVWDLGDPSRPRRISPPRSRLSPIDRIAWSPDGRVLATGHQQETVLWDVRDPARPRQVGRIGGQAGRLSALRFSPDSRTLAIGDEPGSVFLWDVRDPARPARLAQLAKAGAHVGTLVFDPAGTRLLVGHQEQVRLWAVGDPRRPRQVGQPMVADRPVRDARFDAEPDRVTFATVDGGMSSWNIGDPAKPRQVSERRGNTTLWSMAVALSPDTRTLAWSSTGNRVLLSGASQAVKLPGLIRLQHRSAVRAVAYSPDSRLLASGSADRTVRIWDVQDPAKARLLGDLTGHTGWVNTVAFRPDGRQLASAGEDGTVRLWAVDGTTVPRLVGQFTSPAGAVPTVAYAPEGNLLAVAGSFGTLWNVADPTRPQQVGRLDQAALWTVAFSPDGDRVLSSSSDGTAVLWDVHAPDRPRQLSRLSGHTSWVMTTAFSPDGGTVATGSNDTSIILWDVRNPKRPRQIGQPLDEHSSWVRQLAFSPDGQLLASVGNDATTKVWDVSGVHSRPGGRETGYPDQPYLLADRDNANDAVGITVAFGPDGRTLATGGGSNETLLRDLGPLHDLRANVLKRACERAGRGLNRDEWARYVVGVEFQETCPGQN